MGHDVHRDPELLLAHAREAADLAESLEASLRGLAQQVLPAEADDVELERLAGVVRHGVAELGELAAALSAAATLGTVESDLLAALRRALAP